LSNDTEILNLIADIRSSVIEQEELEEKVSKLRLDLESAEDDLHAVKGDITRNREKLDELIDEATGQNEEDDTQERFSASLYGGARY
jgi:chromosome segregation ATPase